MWIVCINKLEIIVDFMGSIGKINTEWFLNSNCVFLEGVELEDYKIVGPDFRER